MKITPTSDIPRSKKKSEISEYHLLTYPHENGRYLRGRGWVPGFQEAVNSWFKGIGHWSYYHTKKSQGSQEGFPDFFAVHEITGTQVWAELKIESGKVSQTQMDWLHLLAMQSEHVYLWWASDVDEIDTFLKAEHEKAMRYNN